MRGENILEIFNAPLDIYEAVIEAFEELFHSFLPVSTECSSLALVPELCTLK